MSKLFVKSCKSNNHCATEAFWRGFVKLDLRCIILYFVLFTSQKYSTTECCKEGCKAWKPVWAGGGENWHHSEKDS